MSEPTFGDLRALLHQPDPSWEALTELLDTLALTPGFDGRILPYCLDHLGTLPARLRQMPQRWLSRLFAGDSSPMFQVVGLLDDGFMAHGYDSEKLSRIMGDPNLGGVRTLDILLSELEPRHLEQAARVRSLPGLERLLLGGPEGASDHEPMLWARPLRAAAFFPHLRHLTLCELPLHGEAVVELFGHPLPALHTLKLETTGLDDVSVESLASTPVFRGLEVLSMGWNDEVGARAVRALSRTTNTLRSLSLTNCPIQDAGALALASSPHMSALTTLCLNSTKITSKGAEAVLRGRLPLSSLALRGNDLRGVDLSSWNIPGLRTLDLHGSQLSDASLASLLRAPRLEGLSVLELGRNPLTDLSARRLATCSRLAGMTSLSVRGVTSFSPEGVDVLRRSMTLRDCLDVG